jgi:hypothetical protein
MQVSNIHEGQIGRQIVATNPLSRLQRPGIPGCLYDVNSNEIAIIDSSSKVPLTERSYSGN